MLDVQDPKVTERGAPLDFENAESEGDRNEKNTQAI